MKKFSIAYKNGNKSTIGADAMDVRSGMVVFLRESDEPLGLKILEAFLAINSENILYACEKDAPVELRDYHE